MVIHGFLLKLPNGTCESCITQLYNCKEMTKFRVLTCRYLLILDRCTIKHTLMAFLMFCRLDRTMLSRRLNRTISCTSTVFMLCLYEVGYFLRAASVSKFGGILDRMSCATSSTTSSVDFPPPDEALAYINNQ